MDVKLEDLGIPGCFILRMGVSHDERGFFFKTFQASCFKEIGLESSFREEYYSTSIEGTVRGMHFQVPPADHVKVVDCMSGKAFDVIVDLRIGSPSYGKHVAVDLAENDGQVLYIARGCAHGFQALADRTVLNYRVTSEYAPSFDCGIRWDSIDVSWPQKATVISQRDASLPRFQDYRSPFKFDKHEVSRCES